MASQDKTSLSLPPGFELHTLREAGNAFAHAQKIASKGAGTLVWARRFHIADFAVVLEPELPLASARLVFYPAMNALADSLSTHCPPQKPVLFVWPDTVTVDGWAVGGGRLAWPPECSESEIPAWMVFGVMLRLASPAGGELGYWQHGSTLEEEGFEDFAAASLVESFARHLMANIHEFQENGPQGEMARYERRLNLEGRARILANGDLERAEKREAFAESLAAALSAPSWLDPERGEPLT